MYLMNQEAFRVVAEAGLHMCRHGFSSVPPDSMSHSWSVQERLGMPVSLIVPSAQVCNCMVHAGITNCFHYDVCIMIQSLIVQVRPSQRSAAC